MPLPPRRRLLSLATAATLTLALPAAGASLLAGPAQSADPVADCAEAFPLSEVTAGDAVTGQTVTRGTTPTGFTGEVLGILEDGVAPGVDMIIVDVDMPEFERTGGIWQGMSGSPVYAEDGRLLGAVAYGLSNGPSPIAGVTPYEDMDEYLATAPAPRGTTGPKRLSATQARTVAAHAGITSAEAARGFDELPVPMGISGITARRLAQLKAKGPSFVEKDSYVLGRASGATAGAETVVAGGNIAASVAYGDVSMAGVGTATSVCDDRVVGFGHPLALLGPTTEALHPAEAVYIQPDSLGSPFKVANIAPPVGTVTDDRTTGITGTFGALPTTTGVISDVTYGTRSRTGTTAVSVKEFAAEATFYQLVANQDRVVDGPSRGSEILSWEITGSDNGTPFTLKYTDRWTGTDLSSEPSYGVANLVGALGSLEGVTVGSVHVTTDITDTLKRHTLVGVEQRRGGYQGKWVRITERAPLVAQAGKTVTVRVVLGGTAGKLTKQLKQIAIPKTAKGELVLFARGGNEDYYYESEEGPIGSDGGSVDTVASIRAALAKQIRHDQVQVQLGTFDRFDFESEEEAYYRGARKPASFVRTLTTGALDHVVSGTLILPASVR